MNNEFRDYIKMLVSEIIEENRPAASQLVRQDGGKSLRNKDKEEDEELDEFSAGGVAGSPGAQLVLPLGKSPKGVKRKKPGWS